MATWQHGNINANNMARYVYGTMIGESMTRDTKSAGAGAMRVVVNIKDSIIDTTNIRDTATITKDITTTSTSSSSSSPTTITKNLSSKVGVWMLYCLLITSAYTGNLKALHHQDLHFRNLYQLYFLTQEQKNQTIKNDHDSDSHHQAFLTNPGLTSPIDTLEDVLGSGLPWGMVLDHIFNTFKHKPPPWPRGPGRWS